MPLTSGGGHILIPQYNYEVTWKVIIDNGTVTDVTNDILSLNITRKLSNLDICNFTLSNGEGKYLSTYNGGEVITVYADYGSSVPTNVIYKGKLDNIYFSYGSDGYKAAVESRQTPEVFDIKIVEQYDNAVISDAIKDIIDKYYSGILTYVNVGVTTSRATISFAHEAGIAALNELAKRANMDLYIDVDGDVHLFERGSVINDDECISLEDNLIGVSKYGKDTTKVFNRIICYGKADDNILLLKTRDDVTSQTDLWVKELVINDNKLTTMEETEDKADIELTNNTNVEQDGRINTLGMVYINPGDYIYGSVPYCGINGNQLIVGFSHTLDPSGFVTSLEIEDEQATLDQLFKDRIDAEERLKPYDNLNGMSNAYTIFFDESTPKWTLVNCEISTLKRLQLSSGQSSGTCTFNVLNADEDITECELRILVNYPNDEYVTYDASNDNGNTWETIEPGILHTFSSTGSNLRYRINLVSQDGFNPVFASVCLLYK